MLKGEMMSLAHKLVRSVWAESLDKALSAGFGGLEIAGIRSYVSFSTLPPD
jgi:hypothetical protein